MNSLKAILSACLREQENSYTINAILHEFPTLQELMNVTEEELIAIKGIGVVKAKQLLAILSFFRYMQSNSNGDRPIVGSPCDVYKLVRGELEYLFVERFVVLGLSTKNHVMIQHTVSVGSLNASIVHPRETFNMLIRRNCAAAILVHNHPSGDPMPSQEDIAITKKLIEAGEIIGIPVLDHVIVGQGRYVSLKEKGLM